MKKSDKCFAAKIVSSDEATFHLPEYINRHYVRISVSNNPHAMFGGTRKEQYQI
jgi:hypothetical protein